MRKKWWQGGGIMALDVVTLANQVREMTKHVANGSAEQRRRRLMIQHLLERHVGHEAHWNDAVTLSDRSAWLQAQIHDTFDTVGALPAIPDDYLIVASDGSQLDVERHGMAVCYVINIGEVLIQYGYNSYAVLRSAPMLGFRDADLYISDGMRRIPVEGQLLNAKRDAAEGMALAKLAAEFLTRVPDVPAIALQDGTLMRWNLANSDDAVRELLLDPYLAALDALKAQGVPVASYISRPRSPEMLGMVRLMLCPDVDVPAGRGAVCDRCSDVAAGRQPSCTPCNDLADADIAIQQLSDGQRGPVYLSMARANREYYREHRIHFFYLRVGAEIARVEVPEWVVADAQMLDTVHAIVYDQAMRGQGYPVALARAHEQAVIKASDRRTFLDMVEQSLLKNEIPALNSRKRDSKDFQAL
jgi:hypothetical protein